MFICFWSHTISLVQVDRSFYVQLQLISMPLSKHIFQWSFLYSLRFICVIWHYVITLYSNVYEYTSGMMNSRYKPNNWNHLKITCPQGQPVRKFSSVNIEIQYRVILLYYEESLSKCVCHIIPLQFSTRSKLLQYKTQKLVHSFSTFNLMTDVYKERHWTRTFLNQFVVNHGSHALFTQFLYCSVLMRQHVAWWLGIWFTLAGVIWQLRLCVHAVDRENDVSVGNQAWYTCFKVSRFFQNLTTYLNIFCFSLYPGVSGHLSVN